MIDFLFIVCSKGKSIFSGLFRLVLKIMKLEFILVEWRVLFKLKYKKNYKE